MYILIYIKKWGRGKMELEGGKNGHVPPSILFSPTLILIFLLRARGLLGARRVIPFYIYFRLLAFSLATLPLSLSLALYNAKVLIQL